MVRDKTRMWFDLAIIILLIYIIYQIKTTGTAPGFDAFEQIQSILRP